MEVMGIKLTEERVLKAIEDGARKAVKEALGDRWLLQEEVYNAIERGVKAAMAEKSK